MGGRREGAGREVSCAGGGGRSEMNWQPRVGGGGGGVVREGRQGFFEGEQGEQGVAEGSAERAGNVKALPHT